MLAMLSAAPIAVGFIEPVLSADTNGCSALSVIRQCRDMRTVVCVTGTPKGCQALADVTPLKVRRILIYDAPDVREKINGILADLAGKGALEVRLLHLFEQKLHSLPHHLEQSVRLLFAQPNRFLSSADIAISAGISITTLYRLLARAGWASPKALFIAARMLKAYEQLSIGSPMHKVRGDLRYCDARPFVQNCLSVFEVTPSKLRVEISQAVALDRLARFISVAPSARRALNQHENCRTGGKFPFSSDCTAATSYADAAEVVSCGESLDLTPDSPRRMY